MVTFPNCKINLGLRILQKRHDGYHDLETVFYPLPFCDALELLPASGSGFSLSMSGLPIEGDTADNLCCKAYELLKKKIADLPAVQIHLHKAIPAGAGLGGGSADASFMLQLLNRKFNLGLTIEELSSYALQLGSDCPFFIINKPCFATARGEKLLPVQVDLSAYQILLVSPDIPVHTKAAFAGITPAVPEKSVSAIIRQRIETWREELVNDFEPGVFELHPQIKAIKEELYRKGAIYASLSGSGSTVFGIFAKDKPFQISFASHYMLKQLSG